MDSDTVQMASEILKPIDSPFALCAPLFAASIIPGPPPEVTTNLFPFLKLLDHFVSLNASSSAS